MSDLFSPFVIIIEFIKWLPTWIPITFFILGLYYTLHMLFGEAWLHRRLWKYLTGKGK